MMRGSRGFGANTRFRYQAKKTNTTINFFRLRRRVLLSVGAILMILLVGNLLMGVFKIRTVDLVFDGYSCGDESDVAEKLGVRNQDIFWLNAGLINKRMKDAFSCINEVQISKYLPDRVAVLVRGRTAVATIIKGEGLSGLIDLTQLEASAASSAATVDFSIPQPVGDKFFMDQDGILFYRTSGDVNLPEVYLNQDLSLKMNLGPIVGSGIKEVLIGITKIDLVPKLMKVNNNLVMVLVDKKDTRIVLNLKSDLLKQLASLQLIWQKNKIDSKRIESIDLRFSKPVVIYSK